jgi:hypothetical protein
MVLKGAKRLLEAQAIGLIYSEVNFAKHYENQAYFADVWQHLREYGYRLFQLYNLDFGTDMFLGHGDAVFLSPQVAALVNREMWS